MKKTRAAKKVVVAGASGFVGRALGPVLAAAGYEPIGLSRNVERQRAKESPYSWRGCELFSLLSAEKALAGVDYAVYLVHSMMPTARLTQGSFRDLDLVCADNFARAAHAAGVKHIIYLGGPVPKEGRVSEHLASRCEVERVLASHGVPVTTLRAGMIIGAGGSSFQMMMRLVQRLPAMVCPSWTETKTQPVALSDVVRLSVGALGDRRLFNQSFEIGVPEAMSYREMMERTAKLAGLKRPMFGVPLLSPRLSRLWVSLVTGAPRELVAPLLESLRHEILLPDRSLYGLLGVESVGFDEAILAAASRVGRKEPPRAFVGARKNDPGVRSVQRLPLPPGRDAIWAAEEYIRWLPRFMWPMVRVQYDGRVCNFYFRGISEPLLVLEYAPDRSRLDRQLFYVVGGILSKKTGRGRLEMRVVRSENCLICALHDFRPSLPWFVYVCSQAWAHWAVMKGFARHLRGQARDTARLRRTEG